MSTFAVPLRFVRSSPCRPRHRRFRRMSDTEMQGNRCQLGLRDRLPSARSTVREMARWSSFQASYVSLDLARSRSWRCGLALCSVINLPAPLRFTLAHCCSAWLGLAATYRIQTRTRSCSLSASIYPPRGDLLDVERWPRPRTDDVSAGLGLRRSIVAARNVLEL